MSILNVLFRVFAAVIILIAYLVLLILGYDLGIEVLVGALAALLIIDHFYAVLVFRSYFKILYDNCDAVKYIKKLRRRNKNDVSVGYRYNNMLRAYLALGLYYGGFFDEAKRVLEEIAASPQMNRNIKMLYTQLGFLMAVQGRNYDTAEKQLGDMENLITTHKHRKGYMTKLQNSVAYYRFILRLKQGEFAGAEEVLNRQLRTATRRLSRVSISCYLADVYVHNGDKEKAVTSLEYAVQNGNNLHIASLAKQKLHELRLA